jgi:hypothetical protein
MIKIRKVEDNDLLPLSEFLRKVFPTQFETKKYCLQKFEYWWSTNPAYSDQISRGWILESDEAIVGFIGNIPVNIIVDGEAKLAVAAVYWYMDPSFRGIYSIRLFNEFIKQKNISVFQFKYRNESMKIFLSRYNFKEYILPQFQQQYIYMIDKKRLNLYTIAFILFNNLNLKLQGLSELVRRLGFLMGPWKLQKSLVQGNALDEEYTSSICTSCDASFLSLHHLNHRNNDIDIFYDVKTLNWLYFSERENNKRIVIQCKRSSDNSLVGYMVFDIYLHNLYREKILHLMEICIEKENLQVLQSLIAFATEIGKQNNINLLILWANSPNIDAYFQSADVLKRSVRTYRYVRLSDSNDMSKLNNECRKINFSLIWPV